jgi:hypothetical protein
MKTKAFLLVCVLLLSSCKSKVSSGTPADAQEGPSPVPGVVSECRAIVDEILQIHGSDMRDYTLKVADLAIEERWTPPMKVSRCLDEHLTIVCSHEDCHAERKTL